MTLLCSCSHCTGISGKRSPCFHCISRGHYRIQRSPCLLHDCNIRVIQRIFFHCEGCLVGWALKPYLAWHVSMTSWWCCGPGPISSINQRWRHWLHCSSETGKCEYFLDKASACFMPALCCNLKLNSSIKSSQRACCPINSFADCTLCRMGRAYPVSIWWVIRDVRSKSYSRVPVFGAGVAIPDEGTHPGGPAKFHAPGSAPQPGPSVPCPSSGSLILTTVVT